MCRIISLVKFINLPSDFNEMILPTFEDIRRAHAAIRPFIHQTPVLTSGQLNDMFGCELFFKCENLQKAGAFKFRGATNAVLSLNEEEKSRGVVTHSSGNHAAALALAARMNGIRAQIVMPENAPSVKKDAVEGYGGIITFCKPSQLAREETTHRIIEQTKAVLVHPYDNFNVICGQGTAALELIEEVPDIDNLIAPVGGGGLLSGSSLSAKGLNHDIRVIGAEPEKANDAWRSFKSGVLTPSVTPDTIADGLLTSLSKLTFTIIKTNVDDIITVNERSIIECMLLIWQRMKVIIEPSSATVLAVIKENPSLFRNQKTGLILSGGNVDFKRLPF